MKEKRMAMISWNDEENKWVLRLVIDGEWRVSKTWGVRSDGYDPVTGTSSDWVHDSIICEIAHLQDLGYEVSVTC